MRLKDRVAVVTGAAGGIGRGTAERLAHEGARVYFVDVNPGVVETAARIASAAGVIADLTDRQLADALIHDIAAEEGGIDILVNAAGITRDGFLHKMSDADWDAVIAVNLTAVFATTRAAVSIMRAQRRGRIINIASAGWLGNLAQANYAASKAGVVGLTLSAAQELGRYGATANAVCPGFIETDMTQKMPREIYDAQVEKIWLGRVGSPSDVANTVAFLASDDGAFVTGEILNVGGGYRL